VTWGICTTNNRFKRSRISDSKTKIKFHSRTGNTWFTPGIEVWSADRKIWLFFDSHAYERKRILIRNMVFGLVPTPAKHVLLVHINKLQRLNIHQGLKIRYIFSHKPFFNLWILNHNRSDGSETVWRLWCAWFEPGHCIKNCMYFFLEIDSFWKLPHLLKRTCDHFTKMNITYIGWWLLLLSFLEK